MRVAAVMLVVAALGAGCGSGSGGSPPRSDGIPILTFADDGSQPLDYADRGRVGKSGAVAVHDVSFTSGGRRVEGYLLLPAGTARRPAVVFVHGSGGDRSELIEPAAALAARGVVALTITAPSTTPPPAPSSASAALVQQREIVRRDVVAVRRAIDVLAGLPQVDPKRIGYLGWSSGAKTGAYLAAVEPRLQALALLSAGADPVSAFVAQAPAAFRGQVRRVLGSVDSLRYIARARPGAVLLEDGTKDEVVPHRALLNMVHAAPKGTTVRWYATSHALSAKAYRDAFDWLGGKLGVRRM